MKTHKFIVLVLLLIMCCGMTASAATIELVPEKDIVDVGDTVRVDVVITGENIAGLQFDISGYCATMVEGNAFDGLGYGSFFSGGQVTNTGVINVYDVILGRANFTGTGTIASFDAVSDADGKIEIVLENVIMCTGDGIVIETESTGCVVEWYGGDGNGDGVLTFSDLVIAAQQWMSGGGFDRLWSIIYRLFPMV